MAEAVDKSKMRIGDVLEYRGYVTKAQMDAAFKKQKETGLRLGEQLIASGVVSEEIMLECLCWQKDVPVMSVAGIEISPTAYAMLSEDYIEQNMVLPIDVKGNSITVVHSDPLNLSFIADEVGHKTNCKVSIFAATEGGIRNCIEEYREKMREFQPLIDALDGEPPDKANPMTDVVYDLDEATTPMISFCNMILKTGMKKGATDIFIEFHADQLQIRYKLDGEVQELLKFPALFDKHKEKVIARLKTMANMDISEKRIPQDSKFKAILQKKYMDCRISTLPTVEGERVVMRLLQKDRLNVTLSNAGFSNYSFKVMTQLLAKPYGLILVTGPTGSGKTTTLYASLAHVWSPKKSVVTVEDPVEYEILNYAQVQVNSDVGLGFAESLRAILRQAPDIILVGEIRDGETAKIACEAAMTGHMVLSTLHANTAASSVMRLTEIGVDHYLMSSVLVGALSQRLVRKLCARCKIKVPLNKELATFAARYKLKSQFVYEGKGCAHCRGSGYAGRLGIHEILVNGPQVADAITRKVPPMDLEAVARTKGFISLKDDANLKILQGLTDIKQVLKAAG